ERMLAIYAAVRAEWEGGRGGGADRSGWEGEGEGEAGAGEEEREREQNGADLGAAIATLASLRLLVRVGGGGGGGGSGGGGAAGAVAGDVMDRGGKWRVNVGWEVIRGLGRGIGVEVEEWLVE
ncbi:hypothetical protein VTH06DRAFT_2900, partial [Thermothelomyces fergusii]